jgi:hypothetical protein
MPTLDAEIKDIVQGDKIDINVSIGSLPGPITKSWFTVKNKVKLDSSSDSAANIIFQKTITTANVPGQGVIIDDGAGGTASVKFELRNADTVLLTGDTVYYFDLQVLQGGEPYTPWLGIIKVKKERTKSTS